VVSLVASGGADGPEDVLPALAAATTHLDWQAKVCFLVLIADAPAHGCDCNNEPDDRYPQGSPSGLTVARVMEGLRKSMIDLMFCRVRKGRTDMMEAQMVKHYNRKEENRELTAISLFDDSKLPATRFHLMFCLDESGSMWGGPWQDVMAAYRLLLGRRLGDQGEGDIVSVVQFADSPRVTVQRAGVAQAQAAHLGYRGGGTSFAPALQMVWDEIRQSPPDSTPLLIFMSDGCDGAGNSGAAMDQIWSSYAHRNLQVHTIAFGHSNIGVLQDLATRGHGQYHHCSSGLALQKAFVQIAAGCSAVDGLVNKFSEVVSDMISVKLMLDYL
jgi:Mg-chelatase subunit ChlD